MTPSQLFTVCNLLVVPGWLLLVFLPRAKWTRVIAMYAIPSVLGVAYLAIFATTWFPEGAGFGSLQQVAWLFSNPWLLVAGWIHYLAFDLFIGAWEVRDAARVGVPHWYVVPCLVLTFLVGPVGLLLYFAVRAWAARSVPART